MRFWHLELPTPPERNCSRLIETPSTVLSLEAVFDLGDSKSMNAFKILSLILISSSQLTAAAAVEKPLFERLGGEKGISALSDAFVSELASDSRLAQNPDVRTIKSRVPTHEAKLRLSHALCKAAGGKCKPGPKTALKGIPTHPDLSTREWFYLVQDANRAMEKQKVGVKERKDLLTLLMNAKQDLE